MHWTHLFALHTGDWVGQSVLVLHCTQAPAGVQTRPPPQSGEVRQATQAKVPEQNGLLPPHWAAVAQSTHWPEPVSQTWGGVQFALVVQVGALHEWLVRSHVSPPVHWAFATHWAQTLRVTSQTGVPPEHWAFVVQAVEQA